MANIKSKNKFLTHYYGATVPYGNMSVLTYYIDTDDTGALINSDTDTPVATGDIIDLGELPEGFCMTDAQVFVMTGMTATATASLGFAYEDGKDDTDVPQDAEYFLKAGADVATAGRLRADGEKLVILPKTARLIMTIAGASNDKKSSMRIAVSGELTGSK